MRNSSARVNKISIRKIVLSICMPIILACISFVILFTVIYSQIGNPGRYIDILSLTTKSSEKVDLLTLHDIYEGDREPEEDVPVVIPPTNGNGESGGSGFTDESDGNTGNGNYNGGGTSAGNNGDNSGNNTPEGQKPPVSSIVFPTYNTRYGIFEISKYDMKLNLYFGDSYAVLEVGIGQSMGSYLPGYGGTTLLCVHNSRVRQFESSSPLQSGDEIKITTNYGVYKYSVTSIKIVDTSNLDRYTTISENNNDLIIYTCYPLHKPSGSTQRMVVTAKLVSGNMLDV